MSPLLDKVTSAKVFFRPSSISRWKIGLVSSGCALSIGPVSQDGRAQRREGLARGGRGEIDGGETDLSLVMSSVFVR